MSKENDKWQPRISLSLDSIVRHRRLLQIKPTQTDTHWISLINPRLGKAKTCALILLLFTRDKFLSLDAVQETDEPNEVPCPQCSVAHESREFPSFVRSLLSFLSLLFSLVSLGPPTPPYSSPFPRKPASRNRILSLLINLPSKAVYFSSPKVLLSSQYLQKDKIRDQVGMAASNRPP